MLWHIFGVNKCPLLSHIGRFSMDYVGYDFVSSIQHAWLILRFYSLLRRQTRYLQCKNVMVYQFLGPTYLCTIYFMGMSTTFYHCEGSLSIIMRIVLLPLWGLFTYVRHYKCILFGLHWGCIEIYINIRWFNNFSLLRIRICIPWWVNWIKVLSSLWEYGEMLLGEVTRGYLYQCWPGRQKLHRQEWQHITWCLQTPIFDIQTSTSTFIVVLGYGKLLG